MKIGEGYEPGVFRLIEGCKGFGIELSCLQVEKFIRYYELLSQWNGMVNLTSVVEWDEVVTRHFLDSASVFLGAPEIGQCEKKVIDIGTGGGFPGIPLKIIFPEIQLALLEPRRRKLEFVEAVIENLELSNVALLSGRAEKFGRSTVHREKYDLVVSRAVAEIAQLVELALPFCQKDGIFVAQKGLGVSLELTRGHKAIVELGGEVAELVHVGNAVPSLSRAYLVVFRKVCDTPTKYPRRDGIPAKRPIGIRVSK